MDTRTCSICAITKPFDQFGKTNHNQCKECKKHRNREYYRANREKLSQRMRSYYTQVGRELTGKLQQHTISSGKSGAAAELMACADLLTHGYEVFRSISQHCSCDIIALKNGRFYRVEVKTGYTTKSGHIRVPFQPRLDPDKFDLIAVVNGGSIAYFPDLD